jgi:hypothetical protein
MDVNSDRGAVRLSLLHYNSPVEVVGAIEALGAILDRAATSRSY